MHHGIGITLLASAAAVAGLAVASAPAAATVQNIGSFYQDNVKAICNTLPATTCLLDFTEIESGEFLVIEQVSCRIITNPQARFSTLQLGAADGDLVVFTSYLTPVAVGELPTRTIYNLNHQVRLIVFQNDSPLITIGVAAGGDITHADCTISGDLNQLPP